MVFPDLAAAGALHVVDFAPPSACKSRPVGTDIPLSDEERFCLCWLFRQAGLNANDYRDETLRRRIPGLLRALAVRSLPEARTLLRANLALLPKAIDALLIGVTSFFRDPEVFQALSELVFPEFSRRGADVRIWGAACSDGSELCSLAVLLAESEMLHRACLLGTDCRASAVAAARRGAFSAAQVRDVAPELRERHWRLQGESWSISPIIRHRMRWRQADVLREIEPGEWDMIFCRNVAIYLQSGAAGRLWPRLRAALRPAGILVTGKAERLGTSSGFRQVGPCLYRREE